MPPSTSPKTPPLKDQLAALAKEGKAAFDQGWRRLLEVVGNWRRYRDILKNNYDLGLYHFERGNLRDAVLRLRFVLWLQPGHADAWFYLGRAYMSEGKRRAAAGAFKKALQLRPGHGETRHLLQMVTKDSV